MLKRSFGYNPHPPCQDSLPGGGHKWQRLDFKGLFFKPSQSPSQGKLSSDGPLKPSLRKSMPMHFDLDRWVGTMTTSCWCPHPDSVPPESLTDPHAEDSQWRRIFDSAQQTPDWGGGLSGGWLLGHSAPDSLGRVPRHFGSCALLPHPHWICIPRSACPTRYPQGGVQFV